MSKPVFSLWRCYPAEGIGALEYRIWENPIKFLRVGLFAVRITADVQFFPGATTTTPRDQAATLESLVAHIHGTPPDETTIAPVAGRSFINAQSCEGSWGGYFPNRWVDYGALSVTLRWEDPQPINWPLPIRVEFAVVTEDEWTEDKDG